MSYALTKITRMILRLMGQAPEIPSPPNMLDMDDIDYAPNTRTLTIKNIPKPFWLQPNPHNTNSMDGFFDIWHSPILVAKESLPDEFVRVGSVVSWEKEGLSRFHQIVEVGEDDKGWYCRTTGLNLGALDPGKIRKEDIKWICLGILFTKQSSKVLYSR